LGRDRFLSAGKASHGNFTEFIQAAFFLSPLLKSLPLIFLQSAAIPKLGICSLQYHSKSLVINGTSGRVYYESNPTQATELNGGLEGA
jgi:hypothetical protein